MKHKTSLLYRWITALFLLALPAVVHAQFTLTTNDDSITITYYTGSGGAVVIPDATNGYAVTGIGEYAFAYCSNMTSVTIPITVTNIGEDAFLGCPGLTSISVDAGNPSYSSINGVLFDEGQDTLIEYPEGLNNSTYIIPANVTSIEAQAFAYCSSLTGVDVAGTVTNIGEFAFTYCTNLKAAYFGSNAPPDVGNAFYGDPEAIVYYPFGATGWGPTFGGAPTQWVTPPSEFSFIWNGSNGYIMAGYSGSSPGVTIPPYYQGYPVTSIGLGPDAAFPNDVASVTIPNTVTSIGDRAFEYCDLLNIVIPNGVTSIGQEAFFDCDNLTSVNIPGSVISIGQSAFEDCRILSSVIISNGVVDIGEGAFEFTSLTSIIIPNSVTNIGDDAFADCTYLTVAYFEGNAPPDDGTIFSGDTNAVVYYMPGTIGWGPTFGGASTEEVTPGSFFEGEIFDGSFTVTGYYGPGGAVVIPPVINGYLVTSMDIGQVPAYSFSHATSVTIPNTVTNIGMSAFQNCFNLTSVTIPGSVTSIGASTFWGCSSLTNVVVGDDVTSIGASAFFTCGSLTSFTIPDSVTNIGGGAFESCVHLASVTIPGGVTTIGSGAFEDCASLTSVTIPANATNILGPPFSFCTSLTNISVATTNPAYASTNGVLFDKAYDTLINYPAGMTSNQYAIPNSVTSIESWAFDGCTNLTSVTIPNSVTNIGGDAFADCIGLTNMVIPNGVTSIGGYTFEYCTRLRSISIPNGVTSIGEDAFYECTSLTSVTIPASVTSIGLVAFEYCYDLKSAYFEGNAPPDDGTAFYDDPAIVYYLPGTTGWGPTFGSVPTELWNPQATAFTTAGNQFGFSISGPTNATVVVYACTNLANPVWLPVSTNTLSSSGVSSFSDPEWTNSQSRYYRFSAP